MDTRENISSAKQENVLKNKDEFFEDKFFFYFFCLGTSKTLSLGEFDES